MEYKTIKTVRISDIDSESRIKFSSLMSLMQEAADEHSEHCRLNNASMMKNGLAWVLTRMAIRVYRQPSAGDELEIVTCALPCAGVEYPREYAVYSGGLMIAYGLGHWSVINLSPRKLMRAGELPNYAEMVVEREPKVKFKKVRADSSDMSMASSHRVANTEIDVLGHINNIYYADMAVNALSSEEFAGALNEINITYVKESRLSEQIGIFKRIENGEIYIVGEVSGEKRFAARLSDLAGSTTYMA